VPPRPHFGHTRCADLGSEVPDQAAPAGQGSAKRLLVNRGRRNRPYKVTQWSPRDALASIRWGIEHPHHWRGHPVEILLTWHQSLVKHASLQRIPYMPHTLSRSPVKRERPSMNFVPAACRGRADQVTRDSRLQDNRFDLRACSIPRVATQTVAQGRAGPNGVA
jgi:hypothetical protein